MKIVLPAVLWSRMPLHGMLLSGLTNTMHVVVVAVYPAMCEGRVGVYEYL